LLRNSWWWLDKPLSVFLVNCVKKLHRVWSFFTDKNTKSRETKMAGLVTPDTFKRFVVLGHNKLAVIGLKGERQEYTLYEGQDIPPALWDLLGGIPGPVKINDGEGCEMEFTLSEAGRISTLSAGRFVAISSVNDSSLTYPSPLAD
jgi:hypothetical protein